MPAHAHHNRPVAYAATASLALHALVLSLSAPALKEFPFASPATIVARLVEPVIAPEPPAADTPKPAAAPKRELPKPAPKKLVPVASSAPPAAPIADSTSVAQYRQQLISSAVRHKRYPRAALDNDWQGDVVVRLSIAPGGAVAAVSVKASSGYVPLDEQALEMFRLAAAEVPVPPALRGQEFGVEVRASYELKREQER